ncbi:unnamed protein product [Prunus armeniaca]
MVVRAISRHGGSGGRSGKGMCGGWAVVGSGVCEGGCSVKFVGCIKRVHPLNKTKTYLPPYPCLAVEESQKVPYPPKTSDVEATCLPGPKNAPPYCPLGVVPKQVNDGEAQGASGGQDKLLNTQLSSEAMGAHLGLEGVSGQVLDVLEADGDGGVAGERED